jgi:hypothetical protein
MRLLFEGDERAQLTGRLGLSANVSDDDLANAVAAKLQPRDNAPHHADTSDLDAIADDYERRRRKRERYEAAVAELRRREHTPNDADERQFELDEHGYPTDWLSAAEQSRVQAAQAEKRAHRLHASMRSVDGPGAARKPPARSSGRVHFGQGKTTLPHGKWLRERS